MAQTRSVVTTGRPTPEFRRQHDVEPPRVDERAFRQGWIVRTRLDQLLADDRITRAEWQVAGEFRDAWNRALAISQIGELRLVAAAGVGNPHDRLLNLVEMVDRLHAVCDAIGDFATGLLQASVVEDLPWAAIARRCRRNPETVRDWTVVAIRGLARAWTGATRRDDLGDVFVSLPPRRRPVRAS